MATQLQRNSVTRLLCTLVLSSMLLACGTASLQRQHSGPAPGMFSTIEQAGDYYIQQANKTQQNDAFNWQVLAVRAWIKEENFVAATNQLKSMATNATPTQSNIITLLNAELAMASHHNELAEQQLASINLDSLDANTKRYYLLLQANRLEQQGKPILAAQMLIHRDPLLAGSSLHANQTRIHDLLASQPTAELRQALDTNNSDLVNGWLRLMAILNNPNTAADQRNWQLHSWYKRYAEHPGAQYLPSNINSNTLPEISRFQAHHIAVLLPLSGKLSKQADAIKNGILSAHQGQSAQLSFFDTNGHDMFSLYEQVQQKGADFILGPLLKNNVEALANLDPAQPQLALNMPAQITDLPHRYYFSLSPEAEAAEAAMRIWEQDHRQPLVFAPNNALGRRMANEFNTRWQQQSGQAARIAYFNNKQSIENDVRRALKSQPSTLAAGVIQPVSAMPANTGPIDSVYMASNATETRFILPYFDFVRDSRSERLPTYVTSRSYIPAGEAPMSELNDLQLADMPWLFGSAPQLMEKVDNLWPATGAPWLRLFALGYDANVLISQLADLRMGSSTVPGLSGELGVTERGVVTRQLQWMEYSDGDWQQYLEQPPESEEQRLTEPQ
ncbi:penicillin-binding protein activator [Oceanisphaera pacifica]|uniref:penicillin-binding protein activator n=1 Tax=Oceanisphaera pacifica TaxID=2818389 RepID=UPI001FB12978|nr:penicillin-binding protein activator [Oceanisphaera pacifica]